MEIEESTPFRNTKRITVTGNGYYIEADYNDNINEGHVVVREDKNGISHLSFYHHNPFMAAQALAYLIGKDR